MNLWDSLSIQNKRKIARYYRKHGYGFFRPPGSKKRAIEVQGKLEDLQEIDKMMRQKANYTIDSKGRER